MRYPFHIHLLLIMFPLQYFPFSIWIFNWSIIITVLFPYLPLCLIRLLCCHTSIVLLGHALSLFSNTLQLPHFYGFQGYSTSTSMKPPIIKATLTNLHTQPCIPHCQLFIGDCIPIAFAIQLNDLCFQNLTGIWWKFSQIRKFVNKGLNNWIPGSHHLSISGLLITWHLQHSQHLIPRLGIFEFTKKKKKSHFQQTSLQQHQKVAIVSKT